MTTPIIYLIRHGEKPPKLADGRDAIGLSVVGQERGTGLRTVFGPDSSYNIKYIIAEHPKKDGNESRPYDTIEPLATLLDIKVNKSIHRDDAEAVADAAKEIKGPGNILICWEHGQLAKIAAALGVEKYSEASGWTGPVDYPDDRFDLIWTVTKPYQEIDSVTSEGVRDLDKTKTGDAVPQSG